MSEISAIEGHLFPYWRRDLHSVRPDGHYHGSRQQDCVCDYRIVVVVSKGGIGWHYSISHYPMPHEIDALEQEAWSE